MLNKTKQELCEFFIKEKSINNWTYDYITQQTSMNRHQVSKILNKQGGNLTIDRIIQALNKLGYEVNIQVHKKDNIYTT